MTSTARARTPWPVHLVRLLVAVEVTIVCAGLVFLGFLALLGVSWGLAAGDIGVAPTVALLVLLAMLVTFVIRSVTAATRLSRDRVRARATLVRLQWTLLALLVLATPITDGWLGVGFAEQPLLLLVLIASSSAALVALRRVRPERCSLARSPSV